MKLLSPKRAKRQQQEQHQQQRRQQRSAAAEYEQYVESARHKERRGSWPRVDAARRSPSGGPRKSPGKRVPPLAVVTRAPVRPRSKSAPLRPCRFPADLAPPAAAVAAAHAASLPTISEEGWPRDKR